MIRDEEKRVDDLPGSPSTMSGREATPPVLIPADLWMEFIEFLCSAPEPSEALRALMKRPAPWEPADGW